MKAMVLVEQRRPLRLQNLPIPTPKEHQILIRINACGVCRTDLHIVDGELNEPKLPLVLGHQIVGRVEKAGKNVKKFYIEDRVGVPWLGGTCNSCRYCNSGKENLCDEAHYTGYNLDGGFAEYCVADERYCFSIPELFTDMQAAPLLCAGLIGYRSYRMTGDAKKIGFYGFGSAAHILIQLAVFEKREVFAFTRAGDAKSQASAENLGAKWAGSSDQPPSDRLDAAIIFAPVGELVPAALRQIRKGGIVVCAGIHMSDIPSFPYAHLWGERTIKSVANLTRQDGEEFLKLAPKVPINTEVQPYALEDANIALEDLRKGRVKGSAVLVNS
ncbi:MAG TPA: zinc-dependent alcohol dehydrogenase family protein [candidate division Zixibacteria bacterium]|nr:zinc-dependent alcohol dehydrogenase family protein [candidate division Zixibacteria bacterium]